MNLHNSIEDAIIYYSLLFLLRNVFLFRPKCTDSSTITSCRWLTYLRGSILILCSTLMCKFGEKKHLANVLSGSFSNQVRADSIMSE